MTHSIQCVLHLLGRGLWCLGCLLLQLLTWALGYGCILWAPPHLGLLLARGMCTGGGRSMEEIVLKYQLPFYLSGSHSAHDMVATCRSVLFPKYCTNKNTCSPHPLQQLNMLACSSQHQTGSAHCSTPTRHFHTTGWSRNPM